MSEQTEVITIEAETDEYISNGLRDGTIKLCPFCKAPTELISGCNYLCCICKSGFNDKSEWCWQCCKPKYQPDPKNADGGVCIDVTHNSH